MLKRSAILAVASLVITGFGANLALADATPNLDKREHRQAARIKDGVKSGELTRPETKRLIKGEVRLHKHEARAKADGEVTGAERARLQAEANRMSKRIYRQKHDAQTRGN
jgi:microcystin-dependent protein